MSEEVRAYCERNGLRLVSGGQDQAGLPPGETPPLDDSPGGFVVDPAFVRALAKAGIEGIEAWRQRAFFLKAREIGADVEQAKELATGAGAPPGAIDVICISLAEISQKYAWLSQWCPEVAILIAAGSWVISDRKNMQKLDRIGAELRDAVKTPQP
jgi:hypothetical protein